MPRRKNKLSRPKVKPGTNNADQAAARDEAAEERERLADNAALEAERLTASIGPSHQLCILGSLVGMKKHRKPSVFFFQLNRWV